MLDVLKVLTTVGDISEAAWTERFDYMASSKGTYYILVVLDGEGKVVGTGGVVVERKFIHGLGLVGHIEDIAVARDQQGKKLGLSIIQALDAVARGVGCYKVSCFVFFFLEGLFWRGCGLGRSRGGKRLTNCCRVYWIVRRRMRGSMLSVGIKGLGWRWRIIIRSDV